jgi:hypothetical protein
MDELASLASSAASTVVNLLATDAWGQVKERIVALWRQFSPQQTNATGTALDGNRLEIGDANDAVVLALTREWESRFLRLLVADAAVASELNRLVADLRKIPAIHLTRGSVRQEAKASGHGMVIQGGRDVTFGGSPSFCACGNLVGFQCQVCQDGLCRECDLVESRVESIPVHGFGYLASGSPLEAPAALRQALFLPTMKISAQLSREFGAIRHVCGRCLNARIPATAEAIADGRICETPKCGTVPQVSCPCCRKLFCKLHIATSQRLPDMSGRQKGGILFRSEGEHPGPVVAELTHGIGLQNRPVRKFYGPSIIGLCGMCAFEKTAALEDAIASMACSIDGVTSYEGIYSIEWRNREIRPWEHLITATMRFRDSAEIKRQGAIMDTFEAAVNDIIRNFRKRPDSCRRDSYFGKTAIMYTYKVIDERAEFAVGPAS